MKKRIFAAEWLAAVLLLVLCLSGGALAQENTPVLPDLAAFADGRLTQTEAFSDDKTQMVYFTGNRQDVRYTAEGYMELLTSTYQLSQDAHFVLDYASGGEAYDYHVYCFSFNGPQGDTVPNMHTGTQKWEISGSDVVLCYSQGRPETENVHFGRSQGFALVDTGERLNVESVIALGNTLALPDVQAYSGGLLTMNSEKYWKGGGNTMTYAGASEDVRRVMESYVQLLVNAYEMEQTDRAQWEHGHEHICCAFRYTGEGADDLKTMKKVDEAAGVDIRSVHVMVSYQQGEDSVDFLTVDFYEGDFSLKDTGERM